MNKAVDGVYEDPWKGPFDKKRKRLQKEEEERLVRGGWKKYGEDEPDNVVDEFHSDPVIMNILARRKLNG